MEVNIGVIYKYFIDPILSAPQESAIKYIKPKSKIIDIACGTGTFVLKMAVKANHVTGIDLSPTMLKTAQKSCKKRKIDNIDFLLKDATSLNEYPNDFFDYATLSMAIHQFPYDLAIRTLQEATRVAREIVIIDYAYPLPKNKYKTVTYFIEWLAGKAHYKAFRHYQAIGGLNTFCKEAGLKFNHSKIKGNGIFHIAKCSKTE